MNVPGLILGLLAIGVGLLVNRLIESRLSPEERWERRSRRRQILYIDFHRPLHERELAVAREILVQALSPLGLVGLGIAMAVLSLPGF